MKPLPSKLVCGLSTRVSLTEFEELSVLAKTNGFSIARLIRNILRRELACHANS